LAGVAHHELSLQSLAAVEGVGQVAGASFHEQVESFKRDLVRKALTECAGNQVQAALLLGVDRGTIRRLS
jgi:DNA-binding protein Fis